MPTQAEPMDHRCRAVEAFCEECVWTRSIRTHFADLFEADTGTGSLLAATASIFFHDLNAVLIEYILLQQCKLTDAATSGPGRDNLTSNYILTLDWTMESRGILTAANADLMTFREKVIDARRKLVAHLDRRARLESISLGAFSQDEEAKFWSALQAFVDAAHGEAVGGPYPIEATMMGDANNLLHALRDAQARAP